MLAGQWSGARGEVQGVQGEASAFSESMTSPSC